MLVIVAAALEGCVASTSAPGRRLPQERTGSHSGRQLESWEADRLRRAMIPLVKSMNQPCPPDQIRVGIVDQSEINAANSGSCQFYVTTGLLRRANESQLRGVMAHEIAHQDLGHVARAQVLGAGLNIGAALLEQLLPGSGAIAPFAGTLIARSYGRSEEYTADRHAVEILRRAGYPKEVMVDTLAWLNGVSSHSAGGFLSTHPAIDDRIAALRNLR